MNNIFIYEAIEFLKDSSENSHIYDQIIGKIIKSANGIESLTSCINECLYNSTKSKNALMLLQASLPQIPNDAIFKNAEIWLNSAVKYCNISPEAYDVISTLLRLVSDNPEANKNLSLFLSKAISEITSTSPDSPNVIHTLKCLENILRTCSGPCGPYRGSIEKYLMSFIDCAFTLQYSESVGKCFNLLQQISGGGVKGTNHINNWKKQQLALCSTFHSLTDKFLESFPQLDSYDQNEEGLNLPDIPNMNLRGVANRIINVTIFLQEMLLGAYPVPKQILPNTIMKLITRGLTINNSLFSQKNVTDGSKISAYLCFIQIHLLHLLEALMICLKCNLIPFSSLICKLLHSVLKTTAPKNAENIESYCLLRCTVYETISLWVTISKGASSLNLFNNKLFPIFIDDVTPIKTEVNLTISASPKRSSSRKEKKKLQNSITESNIAKKYSPIIRKTNSNDTCQTKVCKQALKTMEQILTNDSASLQAQAHKELQEFVIKTLMDIQSGQIKEPYDNEDCVMELYKLLISTVINHHWNMNPPLDYAIVLLTEGQTSDNYNISMICTHGVSCVNSLMRYIVPASNFSEIMANVQNGEPNEGVKRLNEEMVESLEAELNHEIKKVKEEIKNNFKLTENVAIVVEDTPDIQEDRAKQEEENKIEEIVDDDVKKSNEIIIIEQDSETIPQIVEDVKETCEEKISNNIVSVAESDEEMMISLVLDEDDEDIDAGKNVVDCTEKDGTITIEDDPNEIDMCNAFVDLVNE